jgi:hypothetical protein
LGAEFQKYRRADFMKGTIVAPLVSLPITVLGLLLYTYAGTPLGTQLDFVQVIRTSLFFVFLFFALPSAYISTAIFGGVGISIANFNRFRISITLGTVAGIVCGAFMGFLWILFFARYDFSHFIEILISSGSTIFPIAILSGFLAGMIFTKLINRSHKSSN